MKRRLLKIGESGATRQAITKAQILAIKVPLPPHHLQHRFSQFVNSLKQEKTYLQEHLAELDALFASLQSRALSGQL